MHSIVRAFSGALLLTVSPVLLADVRVSEVISEENGQAVLYYLNKRFKLRLQ